MLQRLADLARLALQRAMARSMAVSSGFRHRLILFGLDRDQSYTIQPAASASIPTRVLNIPSQTVRLQAADAAGLSSLYAAILFTVLFMLSVTLFLTALTQRDKASQLRAKARRAALIATVAIISIAIRGVVPSAATFSGIKSLHLLAAASVARRGALEIPFLSASGVSAVLLPVIFTPQNLARVAVALAITVLLSRDLDAANTPGHFRPAADAYDSEAYALGSASSAAGVDQPVTNAATDAIRTHIPAARPQEVDSSATRMVGHPSDDVAQDNGFSVELVIGDDKPGASADIDDGTLAGQAPDCDHDDGEISPLASSCVYNQLDSEEPTSPSDTEACDDSQVGRDDSLEDSISTEDLNTLDITHFVEENVEDPACDLQAAGTPISTISCESERGVDGTGTSAAFETSADILPEQVEELLFNSMDAPASSSGIEMNLASSILAQEDIDGVTADESESSHPVDEECQLDTEVSDAESLSIVQMTESSEEISEQIDLSLQAAVEEGPSTASTPSLCHSDSDESSSDHLSSVGPFEYPLLTPEELGALNEQLDAKIKSIEQREYEREAIEQLAINRINDFVIGYYEGRPIPQITPEPVYPTIASVPFTYSRVRTQASCDWPRSSPSIATLAAAIPLADIPPRPASAPHF